MYLRPVRTHCVLVRTDAILRSGTEDRFCAGLIVSDLQDEMNLILLQLSEGLQ